LFIRDRCSATSYVSPKLFFIKKKKAGKMPAPQD
jgi:hypothetical protein